MRIDTVNHILVLSTLYDHRSRRREYRIYQTDNRNTLQCSPQGLF
jgi:hypothetical protein